MRTMYLRDNHGTVMVLEFDDVDVFDVVIFQQIDRRSWCERCSVRSVHIVLHPVLPQMVLCRDICPCYWTKFPGVQC
jgi:hypothetical protein